jgi:hypothetical protein
VLFKQQTVTKTGKLLKKQLPVYYWLVFFKNIKNNIQYVSDTFLFTKFFIKDNQVVGTKAQNKMEWVIAVECQVRTCFSCIGVKTSYFLMR